MDRLLCLLIVLLAPPPAQAVGCLDEFPRSPIAGQYWEQQSSCTYMRPEYALKLQEVLMRLNLTTPVHLYDMSGDMKDCPGHPSHSHKNGTTVDISYITRDGKNDTGGHRSSIWTDDRLDLTKFDVDKNIELWEELVKAFPNTLIELDLRFFALSFSPALKKALRFTPPRQWNHDTHFHAWLGFPARLTLRSAVGQHFEGENMALFPIRNSGGYTVPWPAHCDGKFWIDTRYNSFKSYCEDKDGWKLLKDGIDKEGKISGVPDSRGDGWVRTSCMNAECVGWKAVVWPISNTAGRQASSPWVCAGDWWIDTVKSAWSFWCSEE